MNTKPSFVSVANLLSNLNDAELAILVNNPQKLKELAVKLVSEDVESTYFVPIADKDVPKTLKENTVKWRKKASDLSYTGPVVWRVREGFSLKDHAPNAGPCWQAFEYLKSWVLKNDEPTKSCYVYFIPRLIEGSTGKNVDEQMALMAETRKRYGLPEHHLSTFGSAAMLTGLVLAHHKRTGEKTPLNQLWARTDTLREDGDRLNVGLFDALGLRCGDYDWDDHRGDGLGAFPLGAELG